MLRVLKTVGDLKILDHLVRTEQLLQIVMVFACEP